MENKLEQLLNSLIEKGWEPFYRHFTQCEDDRINNEIIFGTDSNVNMWSVHIRAVLSKSSGLWQFVCKNKLFPKNRGHKRENDLGCGVKFYEDEPEYYIIECALLEEGELEDFLLNSIKLD